MASVKPNVMFKPSTYVKDAEDVIKYFQAKNFQVPAGKRPAKLTNSQLRNILAITSSIYDTLLNQGASDVSDKLYYLKIQLVYMSGKNQAVKEFIEVSMLIKVVDSVLAAKDENSMRKKALRLCRYMEALVAYFKYYGGED